MDFFRVMDFFLKFWCTPRSLDEKMDTLKRRLDELNALKEDNEMQTRRSIELHPRKKQKTEVGKWFGSVERINSETQDLQQNIEDSNFLLRGFSKGIVLKKIEEVEELFQRGKSHGNFVVENPGWIGQALPTTKLVGVSAKTCMEEIWAYLMDDDFKKIGVLGMGGVGKTTIMKLIHNQLLKAGKFNIVIWITVSKESIVELQRRIAQAMDITFDEDIDETIRAGMICEMLSRKGKFVLILDDVWHRLSFAEVGIPEPSNGSKVLVTTRSSDVCRYLKCREVKLPTLSNQDAWELFSEKVGPDVLSHPDLLPIVKSVAEECAGLPLAIVTIASSMNGVCDVHEWRNALHELTRHVKSVNGILEEEVFQKLQFSYDRLQDEKVKHCFLFCALYPEDFEIDTDELINLWIAEGLVEEMDSMQNEIDKGHTILNKLKNSCLIENGYEGGVKLHDVVRDMALCITRERPRFLVRAGMQLKEILYVRDWKEDLERVSLMMFRKLQFPSQIPPPNCPKLTTLFLSDCNIQSIPECFFKQMLGLKTLRLSKNYGLKRLPNSISNLENLTALLLSYCLIESIPESFFEQMRGLKILDLSHNRIKSLPNSISNLENLTTLMLDWCQGLEKVPSFSNFEALKRLDLAFTNIKDIPHGMERLINLEKLNLTFPRITEIGDGILAKLTSLQKLFLENILVRGEEIGGLRKLKFFKGTFYDLSEWKSFVQVLHASERELRHYSIFVGPKNNDIIDDDDLDDLDDLDYLNHKVIAFNGCNVPTDGIKILSDVTDLGFRECIVDLCEEGAFLSRCIPVPPNIFSSIDRLFIIDCKNIKKLLSSNWVFPNLQNLRWLKVKGCEDMEEIIASDLEEEGMSSPSFNFILPKLFFLELRDLPELKSICGANGVMVCDSIKEIDIRNCPKLKRIPLNLPLQDDGQLSPPSLEKIIISSKDWWEWVEWDAKSLLEPFVTDEDEYCIDKYQKSLHRRLDGK